ncbi:MAG: hypothetical protein IJ404_07435 [Clostridia bacterium]|nr:hypothetical protein [Clostridia bacterium]
MKIIRTILIFTLVFALASCGKSKGDTSKIKDTDPANTDKIDFTSIDKIEVAYFSRIIALTDEQMAYVISLWQEGKWTPGECKTHREYQFDAGDLVLTFHLLGGEFYDETNNRTLFISDEQIEVLRSYIATVSADALAQISVGMTISQVGSILRAPGTPDGELGGYKYLCDDSSEYFISLAVDDELKTAVVTGITKIETEASPEA